MSFNLDKLPELPEGYRWVITEKGPYDSNRTLGYLNIYKRTESKFLFWKFNYDTRIEKEIIYDFEIKYRGLELIGYDVLNRFKARNLIYRTHRMMEN